MGFNGSMVGTVMAELGLALVPVVSLPGFRWNGKDRRRTWA